MFDSPELFYSCTKPQGSFRFTIYLAKQKVQDEIGVFFQEFLNRHQKRTVAALVIVVVVIDHGLYTYV